MPLDESNTAVRHPRRRLTNRARAAAAGVVTLVASMFVTAAGVEAAQQDTLRPHSGYSHGTVGTSSGNLHYVRTGSGPVVVLLHGWPQTWWAWHDVMPALATNHT